MGRGGSKINGVWVSNKYIGRDESGKKYDKRKRESVLGEGKEVEIWNTKSGGGFWKRENLEASETNEKGTLYLDYPTNVSYEQKNRNTVEQSGTIKHGFVNYSNNSYRGDWVGINWDNVKKVTGRTFNIKDLIKEKGFKWDRDEKAWVKK